MIFRGNSPVSGLQTICLEAFVHGCLLSCLVCFDPYWILKAQRFLSSSFFPIFDKYIYALVADPESIRYAVASVLKDFMDDGVRYLELRTTPRHSPYTDMSKEAYVSTVLYAISDFTHSSENQANDSEVSAVKLRTKLILSIDRKNTPEEADEVVRLAYAHTMSGVVGVDLCGNPTRHPISHLGPAFAKAHHGGLSITLHFAEIAQNGPEELENMLTWTPQRLGHVIHVPEGLRDTIKRRKVGLELCLSCNVLAGLSKGGFAAHHFGEWWRAGVPIALSTDDVGIFESPLSNEYLLAAQHFGLDRAQLVELSERAVCIIFGDQTEKERMSALLDEFRAREL